MAFLLPQLLDLQAQGAELGFLPFWSHHPERPGEVDESCLSLWYSLPFLADQMVYPTAEHWLMAQKARRFGDAQRLGMILEARSASEAHQLGKSMPLTDPRAWEAQRFDLAVAGNLIKFGQHPHLRAYLLATDPYILVQASPVDPVWGAGLKADHPDLPHPDRWPGQNLLGFALMEVRRSLKAAHLP